MPLQNQKKMFFWIGGLSYSPEGADKAEFARDNGDYWIVQLTYDKHASQSDSSIQNFYSQSIQKRLNNATFRVYPNPARDILNIHTSIKSVISFIDQSGRVVFTKTINGNSLIDVSKLPAGVYFSKNNATGETKKIIVNK